MSTNITFIYGYPLTRCIIFQTIINEACLFSVPVVLASEAVILIDVGVVVHLDIFISNESHIVMGI